MKNNNLFIGICCFIIGIFFGTTLIKIDDESDNIVETKYISIPKDMRED